MIDDILNSDKIHLTVSQKNFIKETYEILSIFKENVYEIFKKKLKETSTFSTDKVRNGEAFFEQVYELRYPITSKKLKQLKKFKIYSLEIATSEIKSSQKDIQKIKNILTNL